MKPGKRYRTQNNYKPLPEPTGIPDDVPCIVKTVPNYGTFSFSEEDLMPPKFRSDWADAAAYTLAGTPIVGVPFAGREVYVTSDTYEAWKREMCIWSTTVKETFGEPPHTHTWKRYVGLQTEFDYCTGCNAEKP